MPEFLGKIEMNSQTLVESTSIWVDEPQADDVGLSTWSGTFDLPEDFPISKFIGFRNNPRAPCRIILDNGRSGDVIITDVGGITLPTTVSFMGTGDLK